MVGNKEARSARTIWYIHALPSWPSHARQHLNSFVVIDVQEKNSLICPEMDGVIPFPWTLTAES